MLSSSCLRHLALCFAIGALWSNAGPALAGGAAVIWPTDPTIAADDHAVALWLENAGQAPETYQVRVFRWTQTGYANDYEPQSDIIASPPITQIEAQQRQLFRLSRTRAPGSGETAYRVIVDEIPADTSAGDAASGNGNADDTDHSSGGIAGSTVQVRMRYSIPLFIAGADGRIINDRNARDSADAASHLHWWVTQDHGHPVLRIGNDGDHHVRLTQLHTDKATLGHGLYGYVLAHSAKQWRLKNARVTEVAASINGAPVRRIHHHGP